MNRFLVYGMTTLPLLAGCSENALQPRLEQVIAQVQQATGTQPAWTEPWDEDATGWTGGDLLTLDRALFLALRNNRELRADLESIGQADADLLQATLLSNPVINFMIMFPSGGGRSMLRGAGLPMQPLQDLWLVPVRTKVAERELQQTVLRVADRAVQVAGEVKVTYARVQYAQRALELMRENREVVHQSTEIIRIRQATGQATQVEVTLSHIRGLRVESDLQAGTAEYLNGKRDLLLLMGMPSAADTWRVEPLVETSFEATPPPGEPELLRQAESYRLDVQASEWSVRAAEERIRLRRREGWPELALGLGFERMPAPRSNNPSFAGRAGNAAYAGAVGALSGGMGGGGGGMSGPFAPKMREVKYTIGPMIDLEVPIFDWGQAQTARAIHEFQQRALEYDALAQTVVRDVRQSQVTCRQAYEQVAFYREAILPEVGRNLELARESFTAGRESLTVYLDVEEDLISTRLRALAFLRDYLVARAELERRVGGRLDRAMPTTQPGADNAL